jgi:hypothetical protein
MYQAPYLSDVTRWSGPYESTIEDNKLSYDDVEIEQGGIERRRPAARQQSVRYAHGQVQGVLLENPNFLRPIQEQGGTGVGNWRPVTTSVNGDFIDQQSSLSSGGTVTIQYETVEFEPTTSNRLPAPSLVGRILR